MANTTIDPGVGNTTRYYDAAALSLPDSDWALGIWYRPNLAAVAARLWDAGGSSTPNAYYARVSHEAAADVGEHTLNLRFIANDGSGAPAMDEERSRNSPSGWATDSDFLLIAQRRADNLELHICEKGGATYSMTPVAWTLGALSPGTEFVIGGAAGGSNLLSNPYGEFFFLSGTSLSTENIDTLKAGTAITAITASPTRYYKLREVNDPEPDLGTANAAADQNGSGWTTVNEFFADSSVTGVMGAIEPGADAFASTGNVGNNGIRLALRDTDTGALAANLTGMIVSVRATSNAETTLYNSTSGTTSASGVLEIASTALGNIGDYVYVNVEKSDNSIVAAFRVQVIDLNA